MRQSDLTLCHPAFVPRVMALQERLVAEGIPLEVFETVRSPFRQAELYARGRTLPGTKATNAKAWESLHQYGLAVDLVFKVGGQWTWNEPRPGLWLRYQQLALAQGLEVLSFEKPHVQAGYPLSHLRRGAYPFGGDGSSWQEWLEQQIELWGSLERDIAGTFHPAAPPIQDLHARPGITA
jgi:peptidoglycan L-alanyl-D-glutamate endopeptidase CwlK